MLPKLKNNFIYLGLLCLLVIIAYIPSFSGVFVLDDSVHILNHPNLVLVQDWQSWLLGFFRLGRPIVDVSIYINHAISGFDTWSYHAFNLIVHLSSTVFVFLIVCHIQLLKNKPNLTLAFFIALIWAMHPIQTQSVTYIIQRAESLMGLFYLGTVFFSLLYFQTSKRLWLILAVVAFYLGIGSKPIIVTAPVAVLLLQVFFYSNSWLQNIKKAKCLYGCFFLGWILLGLQLGLAPLDNTAGFSVKNISPLDYFLSQFKVITFYIYQVVWPNQLALDYSWSMPKNIFLEIIIPGIFIGLLLAGGVYGFIKRKIWGLLLLLYFLLLLPSSSFIPIKDIVFLHRLYLPLLLLVALFVYLLFCYLPRVVCYLAFLIVSIALATQTYQRNQVFQSEAGLWHDVLSKVPNNPRAQNQLGLHLYYLGDKKQAHIHFLKALEIEPENPGPLMNVASYHMDLEDYEKASEYLNKAIHMDPTLMQAHFNLGIIAMRQDRMDEAGSYFKNAIELKPDYLDSYVGMAVVYLKTNRLAEAINAIDFVLRQNPNHPWALAIKQQMIQTKTSN